MATKKEQPKSYWYTPLQSFAVRHSWVLGVVFYIFVNAGKKYFENEHRLNVIETDIAVLKSKVNGRG